MGSQALDRLSELQRLQSNDLDLRVYIDWPTVSAKQLEIINHPARFKVINGGRRGGKTRTAVYGMLDDLVNGYPIWYSALTYKNVEEVWREMIRRTRLVPGIRVSRSLKEIELPNGGRLSVRSLQEYNNLRGSGLKRHYIDEDAYVHPDAFPLVLEPMLLEQKGGAWFMSSPNGLNHFYQLWLRASGNDPGYAAFKLTAYDNPIVDPSEMERLQTSVAERVWLQEYLGEFLSDGGGVFRNVRACATAQKLTAPIPGHQYIVGVDLGKANDRTWFVLGDVTTKEVVYLDYFSQIDYTVQLDRLTALNALWKPQAIIVEANIGEMFIELGHRRGLPIIPFTTSNATKQVIIDGLTFGFEQQQLKIPDDEMLIGELQAFEIDRTPSGLVKYGAPTGFHDDGVIALALWWHYAREMSESRSWVG